MSKSCIVCGKRAYSDYCVQHKPRRPIARSKQIAPAKKPISFIGKQARKWIATRKLWISLHPGPLYRCHYCSCIMNLEAMTLDHIIPRSRRPDLRYVLSNLIPACGPCNTLKGSKSHDEFEHICHTDLPILETPFPALSNSPV